MRNKEITLKELRKPFDRLVIEFDVLLKGTGLCLSRSAITPTWFDLSNHINPYLPIAGNLKSIEFELKIVKYSPD